MKTIASQESLPVDKISTTAVQAMKFWAMPEWVLNTALGRTSDCSQTHDTTS